MKKRRRRFQITCWCGKYDFPHRLGGGACSGDRWAESYKIVDGRECRTCNANNKGTCEVATGAESIKECEAVREILRSEDDPRLPEDPETRALRLFDSDPYGFFEAEKENRNG